MAIILLMDLSVVYAGIYYAIEFDRVSAGKYGDELANGVIITSAILASIFTGLFWYIPLSYISNNVDKEKAIYSEDIFDSSTKTTPNHELGGEGNVKLSDLIDSYEESLES